MTTIQFSAAFTNRTPQTATRFSREEKPREIPTPREKTVAVYGGASIPEGTPLYQFCQNVGKALAKAKLGTLTGGGPGAMKAVAEGANAHGGYTYGMAMDFIGEEPYLGNDELEFFSDFSSRLDIGYEEKAGLNASVPGGIGTLQELTKKATELYLDKSLYPSQKQIVLFEFDGYFQKLIDYLKNGPVAAKLMNPKVLDLFKIAKTIPEGIQMLKDKSVAWTPGLKALKAREPRLKTAA